MDKACFLDRDGVIIEEENYLFDPDKVRLCKGVPEAIRKMREAGYKIVVVSNQSGIARGYFTESDLQAVEKRIDECLQEQDVFVDRWYYCFHHPKGCTAPYAIPCKCRKPEPGMLLQAAADMDLDLRQSVMIGDKTSDVEAGLRAGCRAAALVRTGHGSEQDISEYPEACDAPDILYAVNKLLEIH